MPSILIKNAKIVTPSEVINKGNVLIENGIITRITDNVNDSTYNNVIDAQGSLLMPGIIDIHTDALDMEIIPRPGADFPIPVAFRELERKMSGCGFTTVFHSLHLGYKTAEVTSRSKYSRKEVFEAVYNASTKSTLLKNKIHLRFEVSGIDAYDTCLELIDKKLIAMLSIMDHTPGQGQYTKERFISTMMKSGKTEDEAMAEYKEKISRPIIDNEKLETMVRLAKKHNIAIASHDDDTIEKVEFMRNLGVDICEFPINMETARYATEMNMYVAGGASNILRGGSLSGNMCMKDAVKSGMINVLCSDYYPPSIIHAIFKLINEEGMAVNDAVNLATLNPAKAANIHYHTGSIEIGKHADLLLIRMIDDIPMITHTIVNGTIVSQANAKVQMEEEVWM